MSIDRFFPLVRSLAPRLLPSLLVTLAACASGPSTGTNAAVDAMRGRLAQAEQDSQTRQAAPEALRSTEQSLASADTAAHKGDDGLAQHQLYLADRSLRIAENAAAASRSRQQMAQMNQQRGRLLADARSRQLTQAEQQLQAYRGNAGQVISLFDLPFETGKAILRPGAEARLQPVASFLRDHPNHHVIIRGNTDSTGGAEENRELSQRRAEAVMAYLTNAGVPEAQMSAEGMGEDFPVASNRTAAGRAQNRRVDIVIQNAGAPSMAQTPESSPGSPSGTGEGSPLQ